MILMFGMCGYISDYYAIEQCKYLYRFIEVQRWCWLIYRVRLNVRWNWELLNTYWGIQYLLWIGLIVRDNLS